MAPFSKFTPENLAETTLQIAKIKRYTVCVSPLLIEGSVRVERSPPAAEHGKGPGIAVRTTTSPAFEMPELQERIGWSYENIFPMPSPIISAAASAMNAAIGPSATSTSR